MSNAEPPEPPQSPESPDRSAIERPTERPIERPIERPAERPIPRGCHPLVFGVALATIQFAATVYFMGWCS